MSKFLLPLTDFNRIYQVAHGILQGVPDANAGKACTFFAAFGAYILNKEYKIPARVVAGAFGFCLNDTPEVAFFGKLENDRLASASDAFHMWIQTQTHVVDFMAPIYREAFSDHPTAAALPRKMMQRPLRDEAPSLDALVRPGDFRYFPDPELTEELVDHFFDGPVNTDLMQVAIAWYGGRRANQVRTFAMRDEKGIATQLTLSTTVANGAW